MTVTTRWLGAMQRTSYRHTPSGWWNDARGHRGCPLARVALE
ncbi:MAG: hypothetical protein NZ483_02265 [Verrucomicrobiae bacterium]|nr:hypothetical protein [Verrucomicrobiae bacterium]MDW8343680.1 hypothetical protein [Verrucomicrobiae bacterium]